jgi:hypothetical protein
MPFYQGFWRVWRTRVIPRFAKKRNGFVGVKFSAVLTPDTLEILAGESPRLYPPFAKRDLFQSPVSQGRSLIHARDLNTLVITTAYHSNDIAAFAPATVTPPRSPGVIEPNRSA